MLATKGRSPRLKQVTLTLFVVAGSLVPVGGVALADPSEGALTAAELVEAAIRHHDPKDVWAESAFVFDLQEKRPDGTIRVSRLEFDNVTGSFRVIGRQEVGSPDGKLDVTVEEDECTFAVDGREPTAEEVEARRLQCDRWTSMRDYYLYLWGMPMKLRDPGTRIDPVVERTEFLGREVDAVRVTYDPEVGGDTWYFYLDPKTHRLAGYRFFHDEAANDGEYILLEGETRAGSMSLTRDLSWFVNADDRFLGKDTLAGALLKSGR